MNHTAAERRHTGSRHRSRDDFDGRLEEDLSPSEDSPRQHGWASRRMNTVASRVLIILATLLVCGVLVPVLRSGGTESFSAKKRTSKQFLLKADQSSFRSPEPVAAPLADDEVIISEASVDAKRPQELKSDASSKAAPVGDDEVIISETSVDAKRPQELKSDEFSKADKGADDKEADADAAKALEKASKTDDDDDGDVRIGRDEDLPAPGKSSPQLPEHRVSSTVPSPSDDADVRIGRDEESVVAALELTTTTVQASPRQEGEATKAGAVQSETEEPVPESTRKTEPESMTETKENPPTSDSAVTPEQRPAYAEQEHSAKITTTKSSAANSKISAGYDDVEELPTLPPLPFAESTSRPSTTNSVVQPAIEDAKLATKTGEAALEASVGSGEVRTEAKREGQKDSEAATTTKISTSNTPTTSKKAALPQTGEVAQEASTGRGEVHSEAKPGEQKSAEGTTTTTITTSKDQTSPKKAIVTTSNETDTGSVRAQAKVGAISLEGKPETKGAVPKQEETSTSSSTLKGSVDTSTEAPLSSTTGSKSANETAEEIQPEVSKQRSDGTVSSPFEKATTSTTSPASDDNMPLIKVDNGDDPAKSTTASQRSATNDGEIRIEAAARNSKTDDDVILIKDSSKTTDGIAAAATQPAAVAGKAEASTTKPDDDVVLIKVDNGDEPQISTTTAQKSTADDGEIHIEATTTTVKPDEDAPLIKVDNGDD